jgi:DNA-directed RNA polymerase specialized sigma24 family protein
VQDASLRAFRAVANVGEGYSRAWLLTIVRNTACTWLRNNRPSAFMLVDEPGKLESEQVGTTNLDSRIPETALIAKNRSRISRSGYRGTATGLPGNTGIARCPGPSRRKHAK